MAKKKVEIQEVTTSGPVVTVQVAGKQEIALLDLNFGREDMNQLVDKVNEIIKRINQ